MNKEIIPLSESREKIDNIDKELVRLFSERLKAAADIAEYKKANSMSVYDKEREIQLLKKISELSDGEFEEYTKELYSAILTISKKYQNTILGKPSTDTDGCKD